MAKKVKAESNGATGDIVATWPVPETVRIDKLQVRRDFQARAEGIDGAVLGEYVEAIERGDTLPPVGVLRGEKGALFLWDGYHRVEAYKRLGRETISAMVEEGTVEEGTWRAAAANKANGLRRTNADKRRAVEMALKVRPEMSDRSIADHCGVHHQLVADVRRSLRPLDESSNGDKPEVRIKSDGNTYTVRPRGEKPPQQRELTDGLDDEITLPGPDWRGPGAELADGEDDWPGEAGDWEGEAPDSGEGDDGQGDEDEAPEVLTDDEGTPIPEHLAPAFETVKRFREAARMCDKVIREIEELSRSEGGRWFDHVGAVAQIRAAKRAIVNGAPGAVCQRCKGKKCTHCSVGYITKLTLEIYKKSN